MNESIEILKKLRTSVENGKASPEVKEKAKTALTDAIEALEQNERTSQPRPDDNEFGLSAEDALLRVIEGRPSAHEEHRRDAVSTLVELTQNVPSRESESAPVNQLARLVRKYD